MADMTFDEVGAQACLLGGPSAATTQPTFDLESQEPQKRRIGRVIAIILVQIGPVVRVLSRSQLEQT